MASRILHGSVISMIIRVYYVGLEFLTVVLLARYLGVSDFGVYAFTFALVKLLTIPTAAGLPELLVRQTAYYSQQKDFGLLKGLMIFANGIIIGLSALIILGVLAVMALIGRPVDPALFWGLCLVPVMALGFARGGVVRGFRRVVLGQLPENVIKPTLSLAIVAISWLILDVEPAPAGAMQALFLGGLGGFAFGQVTLWKVLPKEFRSSRAQMDLRSWLSALLPFSMISGIKIINDQIIIIMLKVFSSATDVGLFRIASQVSNVVTFPLTAMTTSLSPHFAHAHAVGDTQKLKILARRCSQATFGFAAAAFLVLLILGREFISLAFGDEYIVAYLPMSILLLGQVVNSTTGSLFPMLRMLGQEKVFTKFLFIFVLLKIILASLLVPFWGVVGAAITASLVISLLNIWLAFFSISKLSINPYPFRFGGKWR